jgi:hypothetical protein
VRGKAVKTPERVAEARRLRDEEGLILREIAIRLGAAPSTIHAWLSDPDGSQLRARKDSYAGVCVDCGGPTSGSQGRRAQPRCQECANIKRGAEAKVWTREAIIDAIQVWAAKYGDPPAVPDWSTNQARALHDEERAARYQRENAAGRCPRTVTVFREFGSWNTALEAAGFSPRPTHGGGGNELRRRAARSSA